MSRSSATGKGSGSGNGSGPAGVITGMRIFRNDNYDWTASEDSQIGLSLASAAAVDELYDPCLTGRSEAPPQRSPRGSAGGSPKSASGESTPATARSGTGVRPASPGPAAHLQRPASPATTSAASGGGGSTGSGSALQRPLSASTGRPSSASNRSLTVPVHVRTLSSASTTSSHANSQTGSSHAASGGGAANSPKAAAAAAAITLTIKHAKNEPRTSLSMLFVPPTPTAASTAAEDQPPAFALTTTAAEAAASDPPAVADVVKAAAIAAHAAAIAIDAAGSDADADDDADDDQDCDDDENEITAYEEVVNARPDTPPSAPSPKASGFVAEAGTATPSGAAVALTPKSMKAAVLSPATDSNTALVAGSRRSSTSGVVPSPAAASTDVVTVPLPLPVVRAPFTVSGVQSHLLLFSDAERAEKAAEDERERWQFEWRAAAVAVAIKSPPAPQRQASARGSARAAAAAPAGATAVTPKSSRPATAPPVHHTAAGSVVLSKVQSAMIASQLIEQRRKARAGATVNQFMRSNSQTQLILSAKDAAAAVSSHVVGVRPSSGGLIRPSSATASTSGASVVSTSSASASTSSPSRRGSSRPSSASSGGGGASAHATAGAANPNLNRRVFSAETIPKLKSHVPPVVSIVSAHAATAPLTVPTAHPHGSTIAVSPLHAAPPVHIHTKPVSDAASALAAERLMSRDPPIPSSVAAVTALAELDDPPRPPPRTLNEALYLVATSDAVPGDDELEHEIEPEPEPEPEAEPVFVPQPVRHAAASAAIPTAPAPVLPPHSPRRLCPCFTCTQSALNAVDYDAYRRAQTAPSDLITHFRTAETPAVTGGPVPRAVRPSTATATVVTSTGGSSGSFHLHSALSPPPKAPPPPPPRVVVASGETDMLVPYRVSSSAGGARAVAFEQPQSGTEDRTFMTSLHSSLSTSASTSRLPVTSGSYHRISERTLVVHPNPHQLQREQIERAIAPHPSPNNVSKRASPERAAAAAAAAKVFATTAVVSSTSPQSRSTALAVRPHTSPLAVTAAAAQLPRFDDAESGREEHKRQDMLTVADPLPLTPPQAEELTVLAHRIGVSMPPPDPIAAQRSSYCHDGRYNQDTIDAHTAARRALASSSSQRSLQSTGSTPNPTGAKLAGSAAAAALRALPSTALVSMSYLFGDSSARLTPKPHAVVPRTIVRWPVPAPIPVSIVDPATGQPHPFTVSRSAALPAGTRVLSNASTAGTPTVLVGDSDEALIVFDGAPALTAATTTGRSDTQTRPLTSPKRKGVAAESVIAVRSPFAAARSPSALAAAAKLYKASLTPTTMRVQRKGSTPPSPLPSTKPKKSPALRAAETKQPEPVPAPAPTRIESSLSASKSAPLLFADHDTMSDAGAEGEDLDEVAFQKAVHGVITSPPSPPQHAPIKLEITTPATPAAAPAAANATALVPIAAPPAAADAILFPPDSPALAVAVTPPQPPATAVTPLDPNAYDPSIPVSGGIRSDVSNGGLSGLPELGADEVHAVEAEPAPTLTIELAGPPATVSRRELASLVAAAGGPVMPFSPALEFIPVPVSGGGGGSGSRSKRDALIPPDTAADGVIQVSSLRAPPSPNSLRTPPAPLDSAAGGVTGGSLMVVPPSPHAPSGVPSIPSPARGASVDTSIDLSSAVTPLLLRRFTTQPAMPTSPNWTGTHAWDGHNTDRDVSAARKQLSATVTLRANQTIVSAPGESETPQPKARTPVSMSRTAPDMTSTTIRAPAVQYDESGHFPVARSTIEPAPQHSARAASPPPPLTAVTAPLPTAVGADALALIAHRSLPAFVQSGIDKAQARHERSAAPATATTIRVGTAPPLRAAARTMSRSASAAASIGVSAAAAAPVDRLLPTHAVPTPVAPAIAVSPAARASLIVSGSTSVLSANPMRPQTSPSPSRPIAVWSQPPAPAPAPAPALGIGFGVALAGRDSLSRNTLVPAASSPARMPTVNARVSSSPYDTTPVSLPRARQPPRLLVATAPAKTSPHPTVKPKWTPKGGARKSVSFKSTPPTPASHTVP